MLLFHSVFFFAGALRWLREPGGENGASPRGAWKDVWGSFCQGLRAQTGGGGKPEGDEDGNGGDGLWHSLVAWHSAVRRMDRATVAERWALNLEAAGLPPLRTTGGL